MANLNHHEKLSSGCNLPISMGRFTVGIHREARSERLEIGHGVDALNWLQPASVKRSFSSYRKEVWTEVTGVRKRENQCGLEFRPMIGQWSAACPRMIAGGPGPSKDAAARHWAAHCFRLYDGRTRENQ